MHEILQTTRIWIIEDDFDLRSVMVYLAHEEGFEVLELDTVAESAALLESPERLPLGILSDFHLLDGDAETFLLQCRSRFARIPIYCISGDLPSETARHLKTAGIAVLMKPISLGQLLGIFEKMKV